MLFGNKHSILNMKGFGIAILVLFFDVVAGKVCIPGNKACTPGLGDCDTAASETCMQLPIGAAGKIQERCGAPLDLDCVCDPTLTSAEACKPGLSCQPVKKLYQCMPSDPTGPVCVSTQRNWQLIYRHDGNGGALDGTNRVDLLNAIREGAEVKVYSPYSQHFDLQNIQKVSISFDQDMQLEVAHAQNLYWAQPIFARSYNLYQVHSSNGNLHVTQFSLQDPVNTGRQNTNVAREMKWFVRRVSGQLDDVSKLSRVVQDGANVRVAINDSFRHLEFADLSSTGKVQGISLEMRDSLKGMQFNTTEQWLFMHWSTEGTVQMTNWLVNTPVGTGSQLLTGQNFNWYVDTCWQFVYRHGTQGQALSGSSANLLNAINSGKRIKVKIGLKYYEVNVIRVNSQDVVTVQVFDSWDDNIVTPTWRWFEVSTTGFMKELVLVVGGNSIISEQTKNAEITWFAENREWTQIPFGNVLTEALNGPDFRFKVNFGGESIWYQADSVTNRFGLYHENEFVFLNNEYQRRYVWANSKQTYPNGDFIYVDYPLGSTVQNDMQFMNTNIVFFTSQ